MGRFAGPQRHVVHVADVPRDAQVFLDEAVEPTEVEVGEVLRGQAADRQPGPCPPRKLRMICPNRASSRRSLNRRARRSSSGRAECCRSICGRRASGRTGSGGRTAGLLQGGDPALADAAGKGVGDQPAISKTGSQTFMIA